MDGEFIAFLPGDNQDLASATTQTVLEFINDDLSRLLRLPTQQFWQVVTKEQSLHTCLDSFLRFRRRCYDEDAGSIQGSSDLLQQLSQRVFRVFWRMVHPQEAQSSPSAATVGRTAKAQQQPHANKIAELLYNRWLMDVPKMLDLAVLYGPGNRHLTGQLLQQLLQLQPKYAEDILTLAEPLAGNLQELSDTVRKLCNQLLSAAPGRNLELLQEVAEAIKYLTDACLTLQAFVDCLPAAAGLLLHPANHGAVLLALAVVYGSLLPLLQRVSRQPDAAAVPDMSAARVQRLQQAVVSVVFRLLHCAFCTPEGAAAAAGGPAALAAAAAAAGTGPSSSSSSSSSSSKRLPPGFSTHQATPGFDPEQQGQELMNLLMLLAHPSDHHSDSAGVKGSLLAAVNHSHHLDVDVATAVEQKLLALDDAQFDYLLALVDGDRQLLQQRRLQQLQQVETPATSTAAAAAAAGAAGAAGSSSSSGGNESSSRAVPPAEVVAEQVSSIKELLPDYGDGFLTASLYYNSWNTEQAINCLLEGSLPTAMQGLDASLKTWTPPSSKSSHGNAGRSSTAAAPAAGQPAGSSSSSSSGLSWTGLAREAAAADAAAAGPAAANIPLPSLAQAAAAAPKAAVDRRTGRVLGALPGQVRSLTKSIAYELQYEYDDEYDDSFDDLMGPGNDGVCDIEGEDSSAAAAGSKGKPGQMLAVDEPSSSNSSTPLPSPRQQQQQQFPQQQQRGRPKQEKLWVLDGKIYNYKKEGAAEVAGQAGADRALKEAKQKAQEIYGLGPGGNVPLPVPEENGAGAAGGSRGGGDRAGTSRAGQQQPQKGGASGAGGSKGAAGPGAAASSGGAGRADGTGGGGGGVGSGSGSRGGGSGGGRGAAGSAAAGDAAAPAGEGGGRGRGRGSFHHKEQHKSAIANHHRKDRAMAKQGKGMF